MNLGVKDSNIQFFFLYKFHRDFNQPADWLGNLPKDMVVIGSWNPLPKYAKETVWFTRWAPGRSL